MIHSDLTKADFVQSDARSFDNAVPHRKLCELLKIPEGYERYVRIVDVHPQGNELSNLTMSSTYFIAKFHYIRPKDPVLAEDVLRAVGHIRGTIVYISVEWGADDTEDDNDLPFVTLEHIGSAAKFSISSNTKHAQETTKEAVIEEHGSDDLQYQDIVEGSAVFCAAIPLARNPSS